jgi:hypothetical protein
VESSTQTAAQPIEDPSGWILRDHRTAPGCERSLIKALASRCASSPSWLRTQPKMTLALHASTAPKFCETDQSGYDPNFRGTLNQYREMIRPSMRISFGSAIGRNSDGSLVAR